jgi:orotate phosphoribosyltransferase
MQMKKNIIHQDSMDSREREVAEQLLRINTLKFQPNNPFTWASGWKAPIYCDNRKILSYPETRSFICSRFTEVIREKYPDVEVIAGVATGAIGHGVLVAHQLGLPFIYIRSKTKDHGLENLIEGDLKPGQKVVVVEDLVSTGASSLRAAEAVSGFGGKVLGMVAIFTYDFPVANETFQKAGLELTPLSRYPVLIKLALENGEIKKNEVNNLTEWRKNPSVWGT